MYLHTDFVTRFPIQENQKVILFFIAKQMPPAYMAAQATVIENMTYIDNDYEPISIPFVAHYGEHGDFILDTEHMQTNALAWIMMRNYHASDNMPIPSSITEHNYRELLNMTIRDNVALSVTDYDMYQAATLNLLNQPIKQGVFTRKETYADDYAMRKQAILQHANDKENNSEIDVFFDFAIGELQPLIQPNMIQRGNADKIQYAYQQDQFEIAKVTDSSVERYCNQWGIFQNYLEMIRVPYAPVAGLGSQSEHLDMYLFHAQQVNKQAKNMYIRKIQMAIKYEHDIPANVNDVEELYPFVEYYFNLVNKYDMEIADDTDTDQITAFGQALTLDELENWYTYAQ